MKKLIFLVLYSVLCVSVYGQYSSDTMFTFSPAQGNEEFARTIYLSKNKDLLVNASYTSTTMYVYANINTNKWQQKGNSIVSNSNQYLTGFPMISNDIIITNLKMSGNINLGYGVVFKYDSTSHLWIQNDSLLLGDSIVFPTTWTTNGINQFISENNKYIAISRPYDNNYIGATWVFKYDSINNYWAKDSYKIVPPDCIGKSFIYAPNLSTDGHTLIFTGKDDNNKKGAIWVYKRINNHWTYQTKIVPPCGTCKLGSGVLTPEGKTIFAYAPDDSLIGGVYIYKEIADSWTLQGSKLRATDFTNTSTTEGPLFGNVSSSYSGDTIIVGSQFDTPITNPVSQWLKYRGAVRVFIKNSNNIWQQFGSPIVPDTGFFVGNCVGISNDGKIIAFNSNKIYDNDNGMAYVYRLDSTATGVGFVNATNRFMPLQVYPNPTEGNIYINSPEELKSVMVYDIQGREIINQTGIHNKHYTISLPENTPKGLYLIKIQTNTQTHNHKLLKE